LIEVTSRLYVLAKAMELTSKDIISRWEASGGEKNTGFVLNTHMSTITPEQASTIQAWFQYDQDEAEQQSTDREQAQDVASPSPRGASDGQGSEDEESGSSGRRRRRRRRRGGSRRDDGDALQTAEPTEFEAEPAATAKPVKKRAQKKAEQKAESHVDAPDETSSSEETRPRRKRSRRRGKKAAEQSSPAEPTTEPKAEESSPKPRRRTLYSSRRKLPPGAANETIPKVNS
jgi:ribonuclease E